MNIAFLPYYSQQDKVTGKFRINTDSPVKFYSFMARELAKLGHDVTFYVPHSNQCVDILPIDSVVGCKIHYTGKNLPLCNKTRRFHWDTAWLSSLHHDMLITSHEYIAIPLKILRPTMKVIVECGFEPESSFPGANQLFPVAWSMADLVHCSNAHLADMVENGSDGTPVVWRLGYDVEIAKPRNVSRYIDVLFSARASSTNYTNHNIFIDALRGEPYKVLMTDQTNYLRRTGECPIEWLPERPLVGEAYIDMLHRSKVVVGLMENGYGGHAFREAIACGCIPVALNIPEYRELLGEDYPFLCSRAAVSIRSAIEDALRFGTQMQSSVTKYSYQAAWPGILRDINDCFNRRA